MRPILALAILLLGLRGAVPEPKLLDAVPVTDADQSLSLLEVDAPVAKADRDPVSAAPTLEWSDDGHDQGDEPAKASEAFPLVEAEPEEAAPKSVDELCATLLVSAENNDLPVPFFANLIWQESRLQNDAVSPVGALGIAQFMPRVALEVGLTDPFDPRQAIPASAHFLRDLRAHFGNLGFVAAAYNAGARRVSEWLEGGRALPRETRDYVFRVTGQSVDRWRKTPLDDSKLTFVRPLPCRELPIFADMEQAQIEQARLEQALSAQAELEQVEAPRLPAMPPRAVRHRSAERGRLHVHIRPGQVRIAAHRLRGGNRQARYQHPRRERHRSVG